MKLDKAFRSLTRGGVLIVQDFILNNEKTGPLRPALFNINVGTFSVDELCSRVSAAGFTDARHIELPEEVGTSLITAVK